MAKKAERTNSGALVGVGIAIGFGVGFTGSMANGRPLTPDWAWSLIAFGLGGWAVLAVQWAMGRDKKTDQAASET